MALNNDALNKFVDGFAGDVAQFSLHTDAGVGDEIAGGSYSRQNATYDSADAGSADIESSVEFGGPASEEIVSHLGFWASGPTFLGTTPLSSNKTFEDGDTLTITSAEVTVSESA